MKHSKKDAPIGEGCDKGNIHEYSTFVVFETDYTIGYSSFNSENSWGDAREKRMRESEQQLQKAANKASSSPA